MKGHAGKILDIDLTNREISTIDTSEYEEWVGGHGMGTAIFYDRVEDKTIDAFDPDNVITMMTSPLAGTGVPAASARTEIQGISPQPYPTEWFNRSNFGGRFASMLKYAGYDGVIIQGAADEPVWVNVVDDQFEIRDASDLWGLGTWEAQTEIWSEVGQRGWNQVDETRDSGRTTQKPAVACIGPAGEAEIRMATVQHDAGNGAGNAGFGGVLGSKNFKAISVLGTGSIEIADPAELLEARLWAQREYSYDHDEDIPQVRDFYSFSRSPGEGDLGGVVETKARPQGCVGCHNTCRKRTASSHGNESSCVEAVYYSGFDSAKHGETTAETAKAADVVQQMGFNAYTLNAGLPWLEALHEQGVLGEDGEIEADLPWDSLGEASFVEELVQKIIDREGIGEALAEGNARAAEEWGRLEQDLESGLLTLFAWGYPQHYDARTEVEWGYATILGARDVNEHDFNWHVYWQPHISILTGEEPPVSAEELANIIEESTPPHNVVPDYGDEAIYSEVAAERNSWHRHYSRFYKQSALFCDWAFADFTSPYTDDKSGITPEGEERFFNAVTGMDITFEEGMEIGRRIWNLERSIWTLQGRHRDDEEFAAYNYEEPAPGPYYLPAKVDGEWEYIDTGGRKLDRGKVEEFKTLYYQEEGWDTETGRPTRETLEELNLGHVADELEAEGKLPG
ncbi:aldehyde ferredoxin oxidoreductase N-terminal domain-containing protein [Halalkaliarchaeum sp. AArc-GB]|uniref:aldehyde ferredoxin oxidoreductase N-terminal domain-containing protein n=1 Tax=Halalkaliarchaeum sp. AArc-GB TaxID=3074078 RepID=UPI0028650951|nr:aldehyde ferredoxin oxidoreductase N-terminal domain-containing protein [Halalkaliarchaeum sp. AArc-GB]MDR5672082.1 aldehyde ferredoxin oxidoreductase N-terminal domain-containing protein [Halalkaliarchaeum sp. AArc-GB]